MVLGEVDETVTIVEVDEDTHEEIVKVLSKRTFSPTHRFINNPFSLDPKAKD
jgi:hypothetical protein